MTVDTRIDSDPRVASYDRAFEPAILEGLLTVAEALRRGKRGAYVAALSARYKLPTELALKVADNRARLFDVLRDTGRIPGTPTPERGLGRTGRLQLWTGLVGLLALFALFGTYEWQHQMRIGRRLEHLSLQAVARRPVADSMADTSAAALSRIARASIRRDANGRITSVSGRSPADAVSTMCDAILGHACWAMEVVPTQPPFPGQRMGLYTPTGGAAQVDVVAIRRHRRSGRWVIRTGTAQAIPGAATRTTARIAAEPPE